MANDEQLRILKSGAGRWNAWRENNLKERVQLSGIDLSGAILRGANLAIVGTSGVPVVESRRAKRQGIPHKENYDRGRSGTGNFRVTQK